MITSPVIPTLKLTSASSSVGLCLQASKTTTRSLIHVSRMLYSFSANKEKEGGIPLLSLFLLYIAFFVSSTIVAFIFLLSHFQHYLETLATCEVKPLEGFLIDILVLLANSASLVKLGIYKFSW